MPVAIVKLTLPLFIGTILNWLLLGVFLVQIYIYYAAFPHDSRRAKIGVAAVLVLELLETFSNVNEQARTFGAGWGDMKALDTVGIAWLSVPLIGPLVASIGQWFFAMRIYIIGRSIYLPIVICLLSVLQLAAGTWTAVNIAKAGRFSLLQERNAIPTPIWLVSAALCDVLIVAGMVYYLMKSRVREYSRIKSAISRILLLTVETGAICAVLVLVDLYLFIAYKGTNMHLSLCIELSKVYSNSILLIFNSRARITYQNSQDSHISIHVSGLTRNTRDPAYRAPSGPGETTTIRFAHASRFTTTTTQSESGAGMLPDPEKAVDAGDGQPAKNSDTCAV
ncbi:hypothetical protein MIND_00997500 [Mycena indigotica]|uniref:DUF6534 domain-containing protein n=1 Tax=Mycena indigotica TaxID=2126181 RepID=A0A8H6W077_9AGAR|nr:uncharacterized protein MIND_00997500 [Mycena indigotica]KAF7294609.1 hypothetical protein MIND_00997500 [Mycena indigotica]